MIRKVGKSPRLRHILPQRFSRTPIIGVGSTQRPQ